MVTVVVSAGEDCHLKFVWSGDSPLLLVGGGGTAKVAQQRGGGGGGGSQGGPAEGTKRKTGSLQHCHHPHFNGQTTQFYRLWSRCHFQRQVATPSADTTLLQGNRNSWKITWSARQGTNTWPMFKFRIAQICSQQTKHSKCFILSQLLWK